jgi:hypothetical protein
VPGLYRSWASGMRRAGPTGEAEGGVRGSGPRRAAAEGLKKEGHELPATQRWAIRGIGEISDNWTCTRDRSKSGDKCNKGGWPHEPTRGAARRQLADPRPGIASHHRGCCNKVDAPTLAGPDLTRTIKPDGRTDWDRWRAWETRPASVLLKEYDMCIPGSIYLTRTTAACRTAAPESCAAAAWRLQRGWRPLRESLSIRAGRRSRTSQPGWRQRAAGRPA